MLRYEKNKAHSGHKHVSGAIFFGVAALFGAVMNTREDETTEKLVNEGEQIQDVF